MPLPVILVDNGSGSDSLASGAGPATALTGSNASTSADGLTVTLDGSPDLTNVATDGSHAIFLSDSTAGARNFSKITAKDNVAKTVTVANAFGLSLSGKSWAIGGKRATIAGTNSKKLFDNNAAAGDAMPGWIVELQSGHAETISATFTFRRSGDVTDGPIVLRGVPGAGTMPIVTFSNNGVAFSLNGIACAWLRDFEFRNSNATKTASVAVGTNSSSSRLYFSGLRIRTAGDSTKRFWKGLQATGVAVQVIGCEIGGCESHGLFTDAASTNFNIRHNWIHDCGGRGWDMSGSGNEGGLFFGNLVADNASDGAIITTSAGGSTAGIFVLHNTFDGNGGDGLEITILSTVIGALNILNNIFSNHASGSAIDFSNGSATLAALTGEAVIVDGNNFYNNSATITPSGLDSNTTTNDPQYTNASGDDYSIGANLKAKGIPLGGTLKIGYSSTYSHVDPGAAQRQEPAGGGGSETFTGGQFNRGFN